jgi:phosphoenolpyruvate carboxykinase (GTP)
METVRANTIFTNVALTDDGRVWWEGMDGAVPETLTDWQGQPWSRAMSSRAAHPNSRFTAPATQNPALSEHWEDAGGVPLSAILFGGRRATTIPLAYQSFSWNHGVLVGATMASETTAAATGALGVVRRDPMAMLPFCGYNMADYWSHRLEIGAAASSPPPIFQVNWFRTDDQGRFLWPGFGQNMRALRWVYERVRGPAGGHNSTETPIGLVPTEQSLGLRDLGLDATAIKQLLSVRTDEWQAELDEQRVFLEQFGERLPLELREQLDALEARLRQ